MNIQKITDRGQQFDEFHDPDHDDLHGARFDTFGRQAYNKHGGQFDEAFGAKANDEFERQLAAVPNKTKNLAAACPSCGHQHKLVDALRAARRAVTGKSRDDQVDVRKAVREADDVYLRSGSGEPDELHEALTQQIEKTWPGLGSQPAVAKTSKPSRMDAGLGALRKLDGGETAFNMLRDRARRTYGSRRA